MIEKPTINIALLGNAYSGKSTLAGKLLHSLGTINDSILQALIQQSRSKKEAYAFVDITCKTSPLQVVSVHPNICRAETKHFYLNFIDSPGHPLRMKNTIRAMSLATVGIIVIDAETILMPSELNNLKTMLLAAKSMGLNQFIYCVSNMNAYVVNYLQFKFNEIQNAVQNFNIFGNDCNHCFIPITAGEGDNILERSENMSWYEGSPLIDLINSLKTPISNDDNTKPLRIHIVQVFNLKNLKGPVVFGKVESGILKLGTKIKFSNSKTKLSDTTIESIQIFRKPVSVAKSGELVSIQLNDVTFKDLRSGMVLSDADNCPAREVSSFEAEIVVHSHPKVLRVGYSPTFHCYSLQAECEFQKLIEVSNANEDRVENPNYLIRGQNATVLLKPKSPIYLEPFDSILPHFGSFVMRDLKRIVVSGVVKKVNYVDEEQQ